MGKKTQEHLAEHWHISPRTLEQWRWLGKGPKFLKIGARVLYRDGAPTADARQSPCRPA